MSLIKHEELCAAIAGHRGLSRRVVKALVPVPVMDAWILHRHRSGARKVRRVLRRAQQRFGARVGARFASELRLAVEELS